MFNFYIQLNSVGVKLGKGDSQTVYFSWERSTKIEICRSNGIKTEINYQLHKV